MCRLIFTLFNCQKVFLSHHSENRGASKMESLKKIQLGKVAIGILFIFIFSISDESSPITGHFIINSNLASFISSIRHSASFYLIWISLICFEQLMPDQSHIFIEIFIDILIQSSEIFIKMIIF
jgi:hypothetical protein